MNGIREKVDTRELLEKVVAILFLHAEPITIPKILLFLEDKELKDTHIENILNTLEQEIAPLPLLLVRDNSKIPHYSLVLKGHLGYLARKVREEELEGELTPASLQVLTIVAYLGAPTNEEISFIRGVKSTQSVRSLLARGLLKKIGNKYAVSIDALQKLGITKISDLPEYENIKSDISSRLKEILKEEQNS